MLSRVLVDETLATDCGNCLVYDNAPPVGIVVTPINFAILVDLLEALYMPCGRNTVLRSVC